MRYVLTATVEPFFPTPPTTNTWQNVINSCKNPATNMMPTN